MCNQRQGVRSTKPKRPPNAFLPAPVKSFIENNFSPEYGTSASAAEDYDELDSVPAIEKKRDILIATYNPRDTMFTDQTGKFPQSSRRGNNYQIVIHKIDGNSTWVEPMKNRTKGEMILARHRALYKNENPRHRAEASSA